MRRLPYRREARQDSQVKLQPFHSPLAAIDLQFSVEADKDILTTVRPRFVLRGAAE